MRILAAAAALLVLAGCGAGSRAADAPSDRGTVRVLYAGSLVNLMEHALAARFEAATGYRFSGEGRGSAELANRIKGKVTRADVFVSASPDVNADLTGKPNGDWVSWYVTFGTAPLVLGYNPDSRFAHDLKTMPWRRVVAEDGFRLGRTDPALDPKGELAAAALRQVGLGRLTTGTDEVYPEETLVGRLQAGQLDAGFFYTSEAAEQHIPTVSLTPVSLAATYTVTVLNRAPDTAGGAAFVRYLLGPDGDRLLRRHGLTVAARPALTGRRADVPAAVRSMLPAG